MTRPNDGPSKGVLENATQTINIKRRFPENVFLNEWVNFKFFDSDWIFNPEFVDKIQMVLNAEGGTCACLLNLDELAASTAKEPWLFINKTMTSEAYMVGLRGSSVREGWVYGMDRFSCASDTGQWCFYCEKDSEMAVVAMKESGPKNGFESVIQQFGALTIDQAIAKPLAHVFSQNHMLPEWRVKITKAYAAPS
jgi:hypothetical protein